MVEGEVEGRRLHYSRLDGCNHEAPFHRVEVRCVGDPLELSRFLLDSGSPPPSSRSQVPILRSVVWACMDESVEMV